MHRSHPYKPEIYIISKIVDTMEHLESRAFPRSPPPTAPASSAARPAQLSSSCVQNWSQSTKVHDFFKKKACGISLTRLSRYRITVPLVAALSEPRGQPFAVVGNSCYRNNFKVEQ